MKRLALAVAVLVTFSFLPSQAAPAPKAGAPCKKVGATTTANGKKFTCIKSGKKLMWNKGVTVSVLLPTAKPTPTSESKPFIPWSTEVTAKQVSDAAQKSFRDWAKAQSRNPNNHQFLIQDGVFPNRAKSLTAADATAAKLFSQYFPTKSVTVIGRSQDWVVQKLNSLGGTFKDCSITITSGIDYCWDSLTMQGMVVSTDVEFNPTNLVGDASSLLVHEYFHLVQFQLSITGTGHIIKNGTAATANWYPAWFIEGGAEFVSYSVSTLAMGTQYWQGRESVNNMNGANGANSRNALVDAEIRTFSGTQPNGPVDPYIIGRIGTEYLVASVGFQKFMDILKSFKQTKDFEKSFELVTGLTTNQFYEKFEKVRTSLSMPEVSMKLVCITNTPLRDVPAILPPCDIKSTIP
jgi:hypothetical protein